MPFYSNSEYGFEKMMSNPRNRGHWDLKNTGQYYSGIKYRISGNKLKFYQQFSNKKTKWIDTMMEKANRVPLGISKEEFIEIQIKNKPIIRTRLLNKINNGM
ncbi:hypothetical protein CMU89_17125 [Elizabethkingia anophelis]|nr:hypothetical protein [Elizabethkingia anophelis]MDV3544364.1 hypothetical protein [Elizabethkingia anophelis]